MLSDSTLPKTEETKMGEVIKKFKDGSFLEYDWGSFDEWCVYMNDSSGSRKPPRDTDYFAQIQALSSKYGVEKIYKDYVAVYNLTGKQVEPSVFERIAEIADTYGDDALIIEKIFSILYMAMIAEERKKFTKLGKRIKRLGLHKLLYENASVTEAANFMRGMGWKDIDQLCKMRGF